MAEEPARSPVRWAILGGARIARTSFLPALATVGGGTAELVAGRDEARAREFAEANGVRRAVGGYQHAAVDPDVDAVYVPLPNALHAEWTAAALRAGKAVLCEKPLCADVAETRAVLNIARRAERPLWEAFVFPFHRQTERVLELLADGAIGEVREIQSNFHFTIDEGNIRLSAELAGGALADIGCYPVRLGRLVFGCEPDGVRASHVMTGSGVDAESWGTVDFPGGRRLLFSCSFTKARAVSARILGTAGEIRLSSPFHAKPGDTLELHTPNGTVHVEQTGSDEPPFAATLRHIHAVLAGDEQPRQLALDDASGNAAVLDAVRRSAAQASEPVSPSAP